MTLTVVVVGAGVLGCSLADELSRRGASVTVIDAAESVSGTSAATFGWINSNDKSPEPYQQLNLLGLRAHERALHSTTTRGRWFHQTGNVQLAQTSWEADRLEEKVQRLEHNDYDATMLTASQVRELEPNLRAEHLAGGALFAKEGWIDVSTMCAALLHRACRKDAAFVPFNKVTAITSQGVEAIGHDGLATQYSANVVVLAAGNGTRELLATTGVNFPLLDPSWRDDAAATHPTVGLISTTSPVNSVTRRMIHAEGIALRPARNGGITLTDHPTASRWDRTDPAIWNVPDELLRRARQFYPSLERAWTETVTLGTRVLPEDGLTIADWIEGADRVYAVATHSGVTLAAHLAEVVTDEILTGTRDGSLKPFGLSRFRTQAESG